MTGTTRTKGIVMAAKDCRLGKTHVQVKLTREQVKALFSAVNTAGRLSAGRICRHDGGQEFALLAAIDALEQASGLWQADADEWLLD
jgi:hypothetical protein